MKHPSAASSRLKISEGGDFQPEKKRLWAAEGKGRIPRRSHHQGAQRDKRCRSFQTRFLKRVGLATGDASLIPLSWEAAGKG